MWQRLDRLSPVELNQFDSLACNKQLLDSKKSPRVRSSVVASGKLRSCPKLLDGFVEMEVHRSGM